MAYFLKATDGMTYINVDYIERVEVDTVAVSIYLEGYSRVYKATIKDWLAYMNSQT